MYILTVPNWLKKFLMSSSDSSFDRPPTKILPCRAFAFFGSTFLLLIIWSPAAMTLSMESDCENTIKAKPRDRPVFGSVLTLILSISPYELKCSLSSSVNNHNNNMDC